MQVICRDNIRGWPYGGALDDAGGYCARLRLVIDMSCAMVTRSEYADQTDMTDRQNNARPLHYAFR